MKLYKLNWHKCGFYKLIIWPISMVSMATIYFLNCFEYTFTRARSMKNFRRLSVVEILVALNFKGGPIQSFHDTIRISILKVQYNTYCDTI